MKKLTLALIALVSISASATDVCTIEVKNFGVAGCRGMAECTNGKDKLVLLPGECETTLLLRANLIKALIEKGYSQTSADVFVK